MDVSFHCLLVCYGDSVGLHLDGDSFGHVTRIGGAVGKLVSAH